MGRKKKKPLKPWCWYCNREFDDDKILTQHQRAKHYKCPFCHKKLYSGPGLTVHCVQVHKEKLDKIPEALPNRNSVDIDIYGMDGIPEEDLREHERLKRGDDGRSKTEQDNKPQANKSQNANHQRTASGPHQMGPSSNHMHAAMYQHAMSMGMMPPGFPMHPPGGPMSLPPGFMMPPGFPGMLPPNLHPGMPPPPMHPGMPPQPLHPGMQLPRMLPGMPPPPLGFPHMMPPGSAAHFPPPPIGFPGVPPPPPPPPPSDEPSTSNAQDLPPPMSGVGQLIGVSPPNFGPDTLPPPIKPQGSSYSDNADTKPDRQQLDRQLADWPGEGQNPSQQTSASSDAGAPSTSSTTATVSTIARSAVITNSEITASQYVKNYIEVPSVKARIMHPSSELSLEELRLDLSRYRRTLQAADTKELVS